MTLVINQTAQSYPGAPHVQALLEHLGKAQQGGLAVAVNNTVIPKAQWPTHSLQPNDHITIITATQGG